MKSLMFLSFLKFITLFKFKLDIVDDVVSGIETGFKNWIAGGVSSNFTNIISLLNSGLGSGGIGGIVSTYLTTEPSAIDSTLWTNIKTVSESAVVPIAATIVAVVSVNDLVQMVISGNNMRDFDTAIFFKWMFKTIIAITLTSNVFTIVSGIFQLGTKATKNAYDGNWIETSLANNSTIGSTIKNIVKDYELFKLLGVWLLSFLTMIAVYALFAVIMVVLCSRIIEAMMYLSIAPIPMATMMQSEWRQIGNSWLRGVIAVAFQGFFIVVALAFFGSLFSGVVNNITTASGGDDVLWCMVKLFGYSLALIFTVLRTGQISKSMMGAH